MSYKKADYPHRPMKRGRPKSSHSGGDKKKTWLSARTTVVNGFDVSPRLGFSWWQAPMYTEARLKKWSNT